MTAFLAYSANYVPFQRNLQGTDRRSVGLLVPTLSAQAQTVIAIYEHCTTV